MILGHVDIKSNDDDGGVSGQRRSGVVSCMNYASSLYTLIANSLRN